ncbi:DEAD/DEAH box helicase family protein [Bacillus sp. MRMR6]|uniref:DEAD/DEAH box helicase family protein n=1 Tax=Bacillus sp. MRMR6 TaxID=1928617 RepID=UPI001115302A|nr:DEAD/DEAH box helicase family protein [Bacillus sp. MRMR6]
MLKNKKILHILKKNKIPAAIYNEIIKLATFRNPEYYKAQAKRMSTYGIQKSINCLSENNDYLILPRGCLEALKGLLNFHSIEFGLKDHSFEGERIEVNFHGHLTSKQVDAIQSLVTHDNGLLAATTGFGKTVTAAALIAKRKSDAKSQGWPPPHHIYAVWANPL